MNVDAGRHFALEIDPLRRTTSRCTFHYRWQRDI